MTETTNLIDKLANDLLVIKPTNGIEHTALNVVGNLLKNFSPEIESLLSSKVDIEKLASGISKLNQSVELATQGATEISAALKGPAPATESNVVDLSEHTEGNA